MATKLAKAPSKRKAKSKEIGTEAIAQRAYEISLSADAGSEMENWLRAEAELSGEG